MFDEGGHGQQIDIPHFVFRKAFKLFFQEVGREITFDKTLVLQKPAMKRDGSRET